MHQIECFDLESDDECLLFMYEAVIFVSYHQIN